MTRAKRCSGVAESGAGASGFHVDTSVAMATFGRKLNGERVLWNEKLEKKRPPDREVKTTLKHSPTS